MATATARPEQRTHDISDAMLRQALLHGTVAWDIETTGLDWNSDDIATCQVEVAGQVALVKLDPGEVPRNLSALLAEPRAKKVFHHAPFDLRFMRSKWGVQPANVACTKIAAKIVAPGLPRDAYSLKPSLNAYLGIDIDKTQRLSDWSRQVLSDEQVSYAVADVIHLTRLLSVLESRARDLGRGRLLDETFRYLPSRVELDLHGAGDVFAY